MFTFTNSFSLTQNRLDCSISNTTQFFTNDRNKLQFFSNDKLTSEAPNSSARVIIFLQFCLPSCTLSPIGETIQLEKKVRSDRISRKHGSITDLPLREKWCFQGNKISETPMTLLCNHNSQMPVKFCSRAINK